MSISEKLWKKAVLSRSANIQDAISNLDEFGLRIVLLVNVDGSLAGTVSDGDIRRGLLKGLQLSSPLLSLINTNALVVPPEMDRGLVLQLMTANKIQQVPVIDENQQIIGLHLWDDIFTPVQRENSMVIMAGGKGSRLSPHTSSCPKPMLDVAGKPLLEHIIERAMSEGFTHFILAIHYLGEMIEAHFGNGEKLGIKIDYVRETSPLGTAGALSLLQPIPQQPFIITNGDVISDINYGGLLDFHVRHNANATMAVRVHEWQHPFGVVETKGLEITGFEEKPVSKSYINAGVYVLDPECLNFLDNNESCDMPVLFELLKGANQNVLAYPMHEPWLDVGRPEDLENIRNRTNNN
jgi:dTDP-glucose pyrophosphorylase